MAWLGASEAPGRHEERIQHEALEWSSWLAWGPGGKARKLAPGGFKMRPNWKQNTSSRLLLKYPDASAALAGGQRLAGVEPLPYFLLLYYRHVLIGMQNFQVWIL